MYPFVDALGPQPGIALPGGVMPDMALAGGGGAPAPSAALKSVGRVRSVFPETWLWSNASIGFVQ